MRVGRVRQDRLREFARSRRGATAIEYGVVVGGLAMGIAIAVFALGVGLGGLFGTTGQMTGDILAGRGIAETAKPDPLRVVLRQNFATDSDGWRGPAPRRTLDRIGTGLSLGRESRRNNGRESVSRSFDLPEGTARAEIRFEMSFVDSWDNEQAKFYLNGTDVATGQFSWRSGEAPNLSVAAGTGVTVDATPVSSVKAGSWSDPARGTDHTYSVTLGIVDPGETLTLGFGTTLDQDQTDESLLIGNIELRVGP